jgi:hypothetical protein
MQPGLVVGDLPWEPEATGCRALFFDEPSPIIELALPDELAGGIDELLRDALLGVDDVAELSVFPEGLGDEAPHGVLGEAVVTGFGEEVVSCPEVLGASDEEVSGSGAFWVPRLAR